MIGTRVADPTAEKSVYNLETHSWKKFMKEMVAGAPVANFSVQRANVIVRGNARLLASPQVQHMLGSHGVGSIPQSAIFLKKLLRGQDPLNTLNKSSPERGCCPSRYFGGWANRGFPRILRSGLKRRGPKLSIGISAGLTPTLAESGEIRTFLTKTTKPRFRGDDVQANAGGARAQKV